VVLLICTMDVLIVKFALPKPVGTKTVAGTVATVASELDKPTVMRPPGHSRSRTRLRQLFAPRSRGFAEAHP